MEAFAEWLASPTMGALVRSSNWVWPIAEIFHYLGMALLLGTVGFLDLRILGVAKGVPLRALSKLVPLGVFGFALNFITGVMFVTGNPLGKPIDYFTNLAFELKMVLILLAGINLVVFYLAGISRRIDALPANADAPAAAKVVAALSLVFWIGVIYFGRMIMYNATLLYSFGG